MLSVQQQPVVPNLLSVQQQPVVPNLPSVQQQLVGILGLPGACACVWKWIWP